MSLSSEFSKAIQSRMLYDFMENTTQNSHTASLSTRLARIRTSVKADIDAWRVIRAAGTEAKLNPLQQFLDSSVDDVSRQFDALEDALSEPVDKQVVVAASAELIAGLAGRILALQVRVETLETAIGRE